MTTEEKRIAVKILVAMQNVIESKLDELDRYHDAQIINARKNSKAVSTALREYLYETESENNQ